MPSDIVIKDDFTGLDKLEKNYQEWWNNKNNIKY